MHVWSCGLLLIVLGGLGAPFDASAANVLIFGGTGNTGSRVAKELIALDHRVTVFARPMSDRSRLAGFDVDFVVGDVHQRETVAAALDEAKPEVVIAAMQSRRDQSPHGDPEIELIALAAEAQVEQFIYLGSVGTGPDTEAQRNRYPDINYDRFSAVLAEKGRVERFLVSSSLKHTIIRTGAVLVEFGREPPPATGRAYLTEDQDRMGAVTYDDLAALIVRCVDRQACFGKIYHVMDDTLGPEYSHWRCRRFASGDLGAACDHLRPLAPAPSVELQRQR